MNKETFNQLTLVEQVEKFNEILAEAGSIRKACEVLGMGKSTISDRFKRGNYLFDTEANRYIKADEEEAFHEVREEEVPFVTSTPETKTAEAPAEAPAETTQEPEIEPETEKKDETPAEVKTEPKKDRQTKDIGKIGTPPKGNITTPPKEFMDQVNELLMHKDDLLKIIEIYKSQQEVLNGIQQASIKDFTCGLTTKSVKIYDDILDMLNEYLGTNRNLKQQDVFNEALYQYLLSKKK